MKYTVFSDIHGNVVALKEFLKSVVKCEGFICLGDTVGYGPCGNECLDILYNLPNIVILKGNHEEIFETKNLNNCSDLAKDFFTHSYRNFSEFDLLPKQKDIKLGEFVFTHTIKKGDKWIYLYDKDTLESEGINVESNLCIGHTHHRKTLDIEQFKIVNVGSIGQNRVDKNLICWSVFDTEDNSFEHYQKRYDLSQFILSMKLNKYPEYLIDYYLD